MERGEGAPRDMRACVAKVNHSSTLLSEIEMQPPFGPGWVYTVLLYYYTHGPRQDDRRGPW